VVEGMKNELSHAYPNPFNPITRIAYSVKEAGPVTIDVYNVAGRVVRTLLDTELDAGANGFVVWDGTNDSGERCASGVYFYRIAAPGFAASRKMVMLK
jgi:flagellar hook assembly protein FlgD